MKKKLCIRPIDFSARTNHFDLAKVKEARAQYL